MLTTRKEKAMSKQIKVGDMVDFRSPFFGANSEKVRPGIVIEITEGDRPFATDYAGGTSTCRVLWANGRITNEWKSILEHLDDVASFS